MSVGEQTAHEIESFSKTEMVKESERLDTSKYSEEYQLADKIMQDLKITVYGTIRLKTWYWDGKRYISDGTKLKRMVWTYCHGKRSRFVNEVLDQLNSRAPLVEPFQVFPVKFNNGRLENGKFIAGNYEIFTPFSIPLNYFPDAKHVEAVDDYLNQLTKNDTDYKKLFIEMIGSCLITDYGMISTLARFFILVGDGGNGKGTALNIIRAIIGSQNASSLSITQMVKESYFPTMLDVLANLGDELKDKVLDDDDMKVIKNVSTGDWIPARELYSMAKDVRTVSTMIFTSNNVLKSFEKGKSFKRRILWLPMFTEVKYPDPNFLKKVTSEKALEYWLRLAVEGVIRLYQKGEYTNSLVVNDWNEAYHRDNDNTIEYVESLERENLIGLVGNDVYQGYCKWTENKGLIALSRQAFYRSVSEIHHLGTKRVRVNENRSYIFCEAE